jgi:hypothetical protein
MATPLVEKTTIILTQPSDWKIWLIIRRTIAEGHKVWEYCDPDGDKVLGSEPERPTPPSNIDPNGDLHESEQRIYDRYERRLAQYNRDVAQWQTKDTGIRKVNTDIITSIHRSHVHLLSEARTPRESLRILRAQLSPSSEEYRLDLIAKYAKLRTAPRGKKVEQWLTDWLQVTSECTTANLPEIEGYRAQRDFWIAARSLDPEYSAAAL